MRRKNPPVEGLLCAICGKPAESASHIVHRGMGGDPQDKRCDTVPLCGVDHSSSATCHGKVGQHIIGVERDECGALVWYYTADKVRRPARYEGVSVYEVDEDIARMEAEDADYQRLLQREADECDRQSIWR